MEVWTTTFVYLPLVKMSIQDLLWYLWSARSVGVNFNNFVIFYSESDSNVCDEIVHVFGLWPFNIETATAQIRFLKRTSLIRSIKCSSSITIYFLGCSVLQ